MKKFFWFGLCLLGACAPKTENEVHNVIYMIGDGMGLAQVSLLQIAEDYAPTAFDRAEGVALIATRSANNRVTDSAAAGTALSTGSKTNNAALGVDTAGMRLESLAECARQQGMRTGLVVTSHLFHATPAAFYAHVADRNDMPSIVCDMLASDIDLLIGGGRRMLADSLPVLAAVADKHLPCAAERGDLLPRAVRKALELLDDGSERGFFLMVEGSQIDMFCHGNDAGGVLGEMRDFEQAVSVAMDFADAHPGTLVVVTADHETGGLTLPSGNSDFTLPESGVEPRFSSGGHTASIVPVYLYGTGADRIRGLMDNTELARQIKRMIGE